MTEPLYEFIPGQGWVATMERPTCCKANGRYYWIELRKPNPGEYCCWTDLNDNWDIAKWRWWLTQDHVCPYLYESLERDLGRAGISWVTFVEALVVDG